MNDTWFFSIRSYRLWAIASYRRYILTLSCGTGDEKTIAEMTDEELMAARDFWNSQLVPQFYTSSHVYDIGATLVKEIEREMLRRSQEGPPWLAD